MELAKFTEVERLLLESLHEFGPLELTDRNLPTIAASLGTNGKVLTLARNKLIRQGLVTQAASELHITSEGRSLFVPAPEEPEESPVPLASPAADTSRRWWEFWKPRSG